jgi:hypothetical protein
MWLPTVGKTPKGNEPQGRQSPNRSERAGEAAAARAEDSKREPEAKRGSVIPSKEWRKAGQANTSKVTPQGERPKREQGTDKTASLAGEKL